MNKNIYAYVQFGRLLIYYMNINSHYNYKAEKMKKSLRRFFVLTALSVVLIMLTVSFQVQTAKINGTWNVVVATSEGSGNPVFVLKQENDTIITGTYKGQFGEASVKGIIKGEKINFKFSASDIVVEYVGTTDGNSMKGTVKFETIGEGTFTGKKQAN